MSIACKESATANFRDRVEAVFGGLQASSGPADSSTWAIDEKQVYRAGKEAAYSSDEDEQAQQDEVDRGNGIPASLLEFDENEEARGLPSNAFCRALDREGEFDSIDAVAGGAPDFRTARRMPVDKQAFDFSIDPGDGELKSCLGQEEDRLKAGGSTKAEAAHTSGTPQRIAVRRVSFADQPERPAREQSRREDSEVHHRHAVEKPQGRRKGKSYVPDHVKHPEKYTVYSFEEPVTVGGGTTGAADHDLAENSQAARTAQAAAHVGEARADFDGSGLELPAFGAAIEFKPSSRPGKAEEPQSNTSGAKANSKGASLLSQIADDSETEQVEEAPDSAINEVEFQARSRRQRNLRARN